MPVQNCVEISTEEALIPASKLSPPPKPTPLNKKDRLYWCFFLLGCGITLPWNALLSAIDYFDDVYPDYDTLRWISLTFMTVRVVALIINSFIPTKDRGQSRILVGFVFLTVMIAFIPIIDLTLIKDERGTDFTFALLMICTLGLTVAGGVAVGSLVGLTIYMPLQYCQAYVLGIGSSAVVTVVSRAITKACLTDSTQGLRISACIFFFLSSTICLACVLVHRFIIMKPFIHYQPIEDAQLPAAQAESSHFVTSKVTLFNFSRVASKMRMANLNIVLNGAVTLTIYPGVPSDVEVSTSSLSNEGTMRCCFKSDALGDWYGVMLVAIFATGDFTSRLVPTKYVLTNPRLVTALNLARISLIPITFAAVQVFSNPVSISLLILVHALMTGYLFLCSFLMGQEKMQGKDESFIGGNILMTLMMLGFSIGSGFSMLWSKLN